MEEHLDYISYVTIPPERDQFCHCCHGVVVVLIHKRSSMMDSLVNLQEN